MNVHGLPSSRESQLIEADRPVLHRSIMFAQANRVVLTGGRGMVRTDLIRLDGAGGLPGLMLGRVSSTGHEIDLMEDRHATFLLPRTGRLDIDVAGRAYQVTPGRLMVFQPTERRTRAIPNLLGAFLASTLLVPMSRLHSLAERQGVGLEAIFAEDGRELSGPVARYLVDVLGQVLDDLTLRPSPRLPQRVATEIGYLVEDQLAELMGRRIAAKTPRSLVPALHRVRLAEEIIHAESDEALSMTGLADRLGVSLRSLQLAFQEVHGTGPRGVLNMVRLEKARARLLSGRDEPQVTTVALDCGFSHLGRFSQVYAQTFGERPSDTLARRRP
jgi:AraC-like DNA-binding protein